MAKLSKLTVSIGSMHLRRMIWAREVRRYLIKNKPPNASLAHEIDQAISIAVTKMPRKDRVKAQSYLSSSGGTLISQTAWHGWWNGKQHPTASKVNLINFVVPHSKDWFISVLPVIKKESFKTYLFAIDTWSSKSKKRTEAYRLLTWIADKWAPECIVEGATSSYCRYMGWTIPALSSVTIPTVAQKYRVLEPSSVMELMLYIGLHHKINESDKFLEWVFDLISACLATEALMHEVDDSMMDVTGSSGHVMGCIFNAFISKPSIYFNDKETSAINDTVDISELRAILNLVHSLNNAAKFNFTKEEESNLALIMHEGLMLYAKALSSYEISFDEIYKLDPSKWWFAN